MAPAVLPLVGFVVTFVMVTGAYPMLAWLFALPFDGVGAAICIAVGLSMAAPVAAAIEDAFIRGKRR